MPKYKTRPGLSISEVKMFVDKAETFNDIKNSMIAFFSLNSGDHFDRMVARSKALGNLMALARNSEAGTIEGASIAAALKRYLGGWRYEMFVDGGSSITKDELDSEIERLSVGITDVATKIFSENGKNLVASIPEEVATKAKDIYKRERELRSLISKVRNSFQYPEEIKKLREEAHQKASELMKETDVLVNSLSSEDYSNQYTVLQGKYYAKRAEIYNHVAEKEQEYVSSITKQLEEEATSLKEKREGMVDSVYSAVVGKLLESTPVTDEMAEDWYNKNATIEAKAMSRLKRDKGQYLNVDQLKADLKEIYRITGGKIGPVKIATSGQRRASAWRSTINVGSGFSKRTLFHEFGHLFEETNNLSFMAASKFRYDRSGTNQTIKLKKLSNAGYRGDERAVPDSFFDPYVGKVYPNLETTEVVSMGLQQLSSPEHVFHLLASDRDHLEIIVGMCLHKDQAVAEIINAISVENDQMNNRKSLRDEFEKQLKKLATAKSLHQYAVPKNGGNDDMPIIETARGNSGTVYLPVKDGSRRMFMFDSMQIARNFLYLYLADNQEILPYFNGANVLVEMARGKTAPEWFKPGMKLPPLGE